MFLFNPLRADSRVEREARTLVEHGYEVEVIARLEQGLPERETRAGYAVRRVEPETGLSRALIGLSRRPWLPAFARAACHRLSWGLYWRSFARRAPRAAEPPVTLVISHDLDALRAGVRARRRLAAPLVYDAHELFPDRTSVDALHSEVRATGRVERTLWTAYERLLIRRADSVITVSESLADEIARRYGVPRPTVLRNIPLAHADHGGRDLRRELAIPAERRLIVFLGRQDPGRGLEPLIEAIARLPDCSLALMGDGPEAYVGRLRELIAALGLGERVLFVDPVPYKQVVPTASSADIGVALNQDTGLNARFSLPNKLFESIAAGIPVVASDLPDLAAIVAEHGVGEICDPDDAADIARAIARLVGDRERYEAARESCRRAARSLNWELESSKLVEVVDRLAIRAADA